jgi:hypothetical protein
LRRRWKCIQLSPPAPIGSDFPLNIGRLHTLRCHFAAHLLAENACGV